MTTYSNYITTMTSASALWIVDRREDADAIGHDAIVLAAGAVSVPSIWQYIAAHRMVNIVLRDTDAAKSIADSIRVLDAGKRIRIPRPAAWRGVGLAERLNASKDKTEALIDLMSGADEVGAAGIVRVRDVKKRPVRAGILTRIPAIDRLTNGLHPGLIVLTGTPGAGKSTFVSQLLLECVDQHVKSFVFSGELSSANWLDWFVLQAAGNRYSEPYEVPKTGYIYYHVDDDVALIIKDWANDYLYLYDNESAPPAIDRIIQIADNLVSTEDVKVVVIDNLMSIDGDPTVKDFYRQQADIVKRLKAFSRATNTVVILVAHPKKVDGAELNDESVAGSREIINWADYAFALVRVPDSRKDPKSKDYVDHDTDIKILKNRSTGAGIGKKIALHFDFRDRRFRGENQQPHCYGWQDMYQQTIIEEAPMIMPVGTLPFPDN